MRTFFVLFTLTLFSSEIVFAQQIGNGLAPNRPDVIQDLNKPILSGVYTMFNVVDAPPKCANTWQHLFIIRHGNETNNNQLQIFSDLRQNDLLFFRKITEGDLNTVTNSPWYEVATRTSNTFNGDQKINGSILAKEIKVETGWADFVFDKDYNLPSLSEVERYIQENRQLEGIPTEKEVKENGVNLGEMNTRLLQKIEELTLYMIEHNKDILILMNEINKLKDENQFLKDKIQQLSN